jgi:hypothetical protein
LTVLVVDDGGGLSDGDRGPGQTVGQLAASAPKHPGGQLLCLGECLGVIGG